MLPSKNKKILFQITGSIAAFKACAVISQLIQKGYEVQTVLSPAGEKFIGLATLEGLTSRPVAHGLFTPGEMMGHIDWSRWADVIVLCPATANTLNRLAAGIGDDLIGSVFLAQDFTKPYLIFPAMNTKMLNHPATQAALAQLREWGATVFPTASGSLACGEVGEGKLLEPEVIVDAIVSAASRPVQTDSPLAIAGPKQILVTAGGTREPIDGIRFITNTSSGRTGVFLAEKLAERGHQVVLLKHQLSVSHQNHPNLIVHNFDTSGELASQLQSLLGNQQFDAVIHSAAVSDFSVDRIETASGHAAEKSTKLPSGQTLHLRLVPTPKLISSLRSWSANKDLTVIGFKLTHTLNAVERLKAVEVLFSQSHPDLVVANDLAEIDGHQHKYRIFSSNGLCSAGTNKLELANALTHIIETQNISGNYLIPKVPEPEAPL